MTQNTNKLVMDSENCAYLSNMTQDLYDGMAFAISTWAPASNPTWLQGDLCDAAPACPLTSNFSISNLIFREGPAITLDPVVYKYGDPCQPGDCSNCTDSTCHWSFPFGDPLTWSSTDAACRCLPPQKDPSFYSFAPNQPADLNQGACFGCASCAWSWDPADPDLYDGYSAMYRCAEVAPEPEPVWIYGADCPNLDD